MNSFWRRNAYPQRLLVLLLALSLAGCLSPSALDRAVMAYDQTTLDVQSQQLLLNIARAHRHHPLHFTGVSNIAATFNFQFNAGATPAMTGESGSLMTPIFGGTLSENPTISIVPMEGEEFTRRLLTPIQENKLTMLLRQGADVDLVLRLLADQLRLSESGGSHQVVHNQPADVGGYRRFRQLVLHLSSIQDRRALYVEPLLFTRTWQLAYPLNAEQLLALQKELDVDTAPNAVSVRKRVSGRMILTNYNPQLLNNQERIKLHEEADSAAANEVMVDIRAGYPGGELPMHGFFRLRSFYNVLNFVGRSITDEPEQPVERDPKTPDVSENPDYALALEVSDTPWFDGGMAVDYEGLSYRLKPDSHYQWNNEGFRLLHQVFQMTMAELPNQTGPAITIAK